MNIIHFDQIYYFDAKIFYINISFLLYLKYNANARFRGLNAELCGVRVLFCAALHALLLHAVGIPSQIITSAANMGKAKGRKGQGSAGNGGASAPKAKAAVKKVLLKKAAGKKNNAPRQVAAAAAAKRPKAKKASAPVKQNGAKIFFNGMPNIVIVFAAYFTYLVIVVLRLQTRRRCKVRDAFDVRPIFTRSHFFISATTGRPTAVKKTLEATKKRPAQRVNLGGTAPFVALKPTGGQAIGVSLKTAEAISRDHSHPNRAEVHELLKTFERGWIDANKFNSLLARYIA